MAASSFSLDEHFYADCGKGYRALWFAHCYEHVGCGLRRGGGAYGHVRGGIFVRGAGFLHVDFPSSAVASLLWGCVFYAVLRMGSHGIGNFRFVWLALGWLEFRCDKKLCPCLPVMANAVGGFLRLLVGLRRCWQMTLGFGDVAFAQRLGYGCRLMVELLER